MAILSFKKRFASKVRNGRKRQTIREFRKYPVLMWEHLYLYTGLRTKHTEKLGEGQCTGTRTITITKHSVTIHDMLKVKLKTLDQLNQFAKADGFSSWTNMKLFWMDEHGSDCFPFKGTIIYFQLVPKKMWGKPKYTRKELKKQFA